LHGIKEETEGEKERRDCCVCELVMMEIGEL
jgi:hypothetical protein